MKSHHILLGALCLVVVLAPVQVSAASSPRCTLDVETPHGETTIKSSGEVLIKKGDTVTIAWESEGAVKAVDAKKKAVKLDGSLTATPRKTTTYSYTFSKGREKVTCAVTVAIASASLTTKSLATSLNTHTLTGKAKDVAEVVISVREKGSETILFESDALTLKRGKWRVDLPTILDPGKYEVTIEGVVAGDTYPLAVGALTVKGKKGENGSTKNVATTFAVAPIPLLMGGTARAGESIPVSYLQITNIGKKEATLTGFWVTQEGNASVGSIVGLATVDDRGGSQGYAGGVRGGSVFKGGKAFAPTKTIFAPGEMRLFTIKAVLGDTLTSEIGKQIKISVDSVQATASIKGSFPLAGTTWVIGR